MIKKVLATLTLLLAGVVGIYFLASHEIRSRLDNVMEQAVASGRYQELNYQDMNLALNGDIHLNKVRIVEADGIPYVIERARIFDYDLTHEVPYYMTIETTGISFPEGLPDLDPDQAQANAISDYLDSLKIDDVLPATLTYRYLYDPQENHEMSGYMAFSLPGALAGSFDLTIRGVPPGLIFGMNPEDGEQAQAMALAFLANSDIPSINLTLSDQGMVDEMIRIGAETNNMSPINFRDQLRIQAQGLTFMAPVSLQEFANSLAGHLTTFIDGQATLSISMRPEYNGEIQRLQTEIMAAAMNQNFAAIPELLNLEITSGPTVVESSDR